MARRPAPPRAWPPGRRARVPPGTRADEMTALRSGTAWAAATAILLAPAAAWAAAEGASELVRRGLAAFEQLDYRRARVLLERAPADELTPEERIAVHRTLAVCRIAAGDEAGALEALL